VVSVDLTLQLGSQGASEVTNDFKRIGQAGQQAGDDVAQGARKGEQSLAKMEQEAKKAAQSLLRSKQAAERTRDALGRFVKEASRTERALNKIGLSGKGIGRIRDIAMATGFNLRQLAADATQLAQSFAAIAQEGAQLQGVTRAFEAMGNTGADMQRLREATKGFVDDANLQKMQNLAQLFGINAKQVSQLAEIAVGASVATGESVEKMFSDVLTAASRQSRMIADNLGIVISTTEAYRNAARRLGVSVDSLTDAQKSQAFTAELIAKADKQRAIAATASANVVAKQATSVANFSNQLKTVVADIAASDEMTRTLSEAFGGFGDTLDSARPALVALGGEVATMAVEALGLMANNLKSVVPILPTLTGLVGFATTAFGALSPVIGGVVHVASQLMEFALRPLLKVFALVTHAVGNVAGVISSDLEASLKDASRGFRDAVRSMDRSRDAINKVMEGSKRAADAGEKLAGVQHKVAGSTKEVTKALGTVNNTLKVTVDAFGQASVQMTDFKNKAGALSNQAKQTADNIAKMYALFATDRSNEIDIDTVSIQNLREIGDAAFDTANRMTKADADVAASNLLKRVGDDADAARREIERLVQFEEDAFFKSRPNLDRNDDSSMGTGIALAAFEEREKMLKASVKQILREKKALESSGRAARKAAKDVNALGDAYAGITNAVKVGSAALGDALVAGVDNVQTTSRMMAWLERLEREFVIDMRATGYHMARGLIDMFTVETEPFWAITEAKIAAARAAGATNQADFDQLVSNLSGVAAESDEAAAATLRVTTAIESSAIAALEQSENLQTAYDGMVAGTATLTQGLASAGMAGIAIARAATRETVKNKKHQAYIEGGFQIAEAAASVAIGNIPKAILHGLAAGKYFAVAGGGAGGARATQASNNSQSRRARQRTQLTSQDTSFQRTRGGGVVNNVFVSTFDRRGVGDVVIDAINKSGRLNNGNTIDPRTIGQNRQGVFG